MTTKSNDTTTSSLFRLENREDIKFVVFPDAESNSLFETVKSAIEYYGNWDSAQTEDGSYPLFLLLDNLEAIESWIKKQSRGSAATDGRKFLKVISAEIHAQDTLSQTRISNNEVKFGDLKVAFKIGVEVYVGTGDEMQGAVVTGIRRHSSMMGPYWTIELGTISNRSCKIGADTQSINVRFFEGVISLNELPIRLINDKVRATLTARGEVFRRYADGSQHIAYTGTIVQPSWWSDREYRATGRAMLDINAMRMVDPEFYNTISRGAPDVEDEDDDAPKEAQLIISDADLWKTSPYLYGFSFTAKAWGRFKVVNVAPIQWRDDAFDKLVLPTEEKEMIRALVEHNSGSFTDIIDGKGGGCIFLLHGPPGQGKTLTAETISELLHKPLYMISVGELGTNPDELEKRLRTILDIATLWDAVLLLDEADIFLEKRDETNIVRNAMVGVFLRLLEYHQGVLFLTTNRVRNIDSAFYSRISVALRFEESDAEKRRKIWTNLLDSAGLGDAIDAAALSVHDINGRQIKTSIRLAQTLARSKDELVTQSLIERTILLGARFSKENA